MNIKRLGIMTAAVGLAAMLTGCGSKDGSADNSKDPASYMEQCEALLENLPEEETYISAEGVTYPKFEKKTYYSQTAERDTPVNILLPENYSEDKQYPVVYILHGYWDTEEWMTRPVVHISSMLNNLIKKGEAREMIVVCPYIYCSKDQEKCSAMDAKNTAAYDNFVNDLLTDLMPFIEQNYSVAKGRENTAITGFSMGGMEAMSIAFAHPDLFGYIGAACPAPGISNSVFAELDTKFGDNKPYLFLLTASEADNVVGQIPFGYEDQLVKNGTQHIFHKLEKTGHDHSSVTPHLNNFFRMIFR